MLADLDVNPTMFDGASSRLSVKSTAVQVYLHSAAKFCCVKATLSVFLMQCCNQSLIS